MDFQQTYDHIRSGGAGFYPHQRGLIAVWGKEAIQFLDGLVTNDMKTLEDGSQMLAAFPNAQGRLLAVVRVLRQGERFLFETEESTREKVFQNLFRFTFAGDFFVEDLSDHFRFLEIFGQKNSPPYEGGVAAFRGRGGSLMIAVEKSDSEGMIKNIVSGGSAEISDELYETLRIENGVPKYGVDMDETTVVPEVGLEELISYKKGCYIGQEIIARIHFRGHVAKRLTGLIASEPGAITTGFRPGDELETLDGKKAGRITSRTFSPKLDKSIGLAYVRYDYLVEGTELDMGGSKAIVTDLPFV